MKKFLTFVLVLAMVLSVSSVAMADGTVTLPDSITATDFGANTVTDGTNYYPTMKAALEGIHLTDKATLWCRPGADVGIMTHGHVCKTLTVYGNGAFVSGGEQEFEVDTYKFCHSSANTCLGLTEDLTLTVYNLKGAGAWGQRTSSYDVNLVFEGCEDMSRIYITGTSGNNNIELTDCTFTSNTGGNCKVYSNANGEVTLTNCDFSNVDVPVNLNHKVAGTQIINISDCSFDTCGTNAYEYAAPVRVLSSVNGASSELTVSDCAFNNTVTNSIGQSADILLDTGVGTTNISVSDTAANVLEDNSAGNATNDDAVVVGTNQKYTTDGGLETIPVPATKPVSPSISVKYNGGNSFSTSNPAVPTGVEIDGVPVTFNGTGSNFTVGCINPGAKWVTVKWNSTTVTTNFTPDGLVECTTVSIPKTGDMSIWAAVAAFFGF